MKSALFALILLIAQPLPVQAAHKDNNLPTEAAQALQAPTQVILYSLEPWERTTARGKNLHGYKILGRTTLDPKQTQIAVAAFQTAVSGWDGMLAMCFDPRHALQVTSNGKTYDFLLCYACHQLYVYRGEKLLAGIGASGSSKALNSLLTAAKIPLSKSK